MADNVTYKGAPKVGLRNVGSYQVSGHPFITGSSLVQNEEKLISFPYVTKSVTIIASGNFDHADTSIRVHFAPTGSAAGNVVTGPKYVEFDTHEDSLTFDVKCKEIYISRKVSAQTEVCGFRMYASLTSIPTGSMYELTGSGISEA